MCGLDRKSPYMVVEILPSFFLYEHKVVYEDGGFSAACIVFTLAGTGIGRFVLWAGATPVKHQAHTDK